MLRAALYRLAGRIAPKLRNSYSDRRLCEEADALARYAASTSEIDSLVAAVLASKRFRPLQVAAEIATLVELVRDLKPSRICEIGAYRGGTVFLFSQVAPAGARLLSLDLRYPRSRVLSNPRLAGGRTHIECLGGDSHSTATLDSVRRWLEGEQLDFLFIDGDHSFDGVRRDFEMYSPLVRKGGLIAFHDIVPDFRTRFGTPSASDVGEVPRFWQVIKERHPGAREIVANPDQDGYGIGVVSV